MKSIIISLLVLMGATANAKTLPTSGTLYCSHDTGDGWRGFEITLGEASIKATAQVPGNPSPTEFAKSADGKFEGVDLERNKWTFVFTEPAPEVTSVQWDLEVNGKYYACGDAY